MQRLSPFRTLIFGILQGASNAGYLLSITDNISYRAQPSFQLCGGMGHISLVVVNDAGNKSFSTNLPLSRFLL